jgi:hypothetical protein
MLHPCFARSRHLRHRLRSIPATRISRSMTRHAPLKCEEPVHQDLLARGYVTIYDAITCDLVDPADDSALDFSCYNEYRLPRSTNRYSIVLSGRANHSALTYTVERQ